MSTIRRGTLPVDHFTMISNDWLRDDTLSWAARGLLCWIASHAVGYDITEAAIVASGPSSRDAIRTMLQALETAGYLTRERTSLVTGGSTVDYVLSDPRGSENPTLPRGGFSDPRADQPEKAVSAGQPRVGFSDSRSLLEDQEKTKTTSLSTRVTAPTTKATRVPEDFQPDESMRAWFVAEQLGQAIDGRIEHEKFMDYWRATPGVKGRKADWRATWRNWMRTAAERAPRRPGNFLVPASGAPRQYTSTTDGKVMQTLDLAEKFRLMEENK